MCKIRFSITGYIIKLPLFISRIGIVEESAIRELKERLYANKIALMAAFEETDKEKTGELKTEIREHESKVQWTSSSSHPTPNRHIILFLDKATREI